MSIAVLRAVAGSLLPSNSVDQARPYYIADTRSPDADCFGLETLEI